MTPLHPDIQPYSSAHKPLLLDIFRHNVPKFFAPHEEILLSNYLESAGETFSVIYLGDSIAGGVGHKVNRETGIGVIVWIFFGLEFHGKGLGRFAVEWCLKRLIADHDCKRIEVRTSQWANKFFERFGFRTFHFEQDYWGKGLDLYHMELKDELR